MKYNKSHFTIDQQIQKIKSDGFIVNNEDQLRIILENLNYYKLKGYIYSTKKEYGDSFSEKNIDILEVIDTYNFDEKLRTFLFEILEKIEVSLKSKIANVLSNDIGTFGYLDTDNFKVKLGSKKYFSHTNFLTNLENYQNRSKEDFMVHYRSKYTKEKYTPLWMMVELLPFGDLSRFYEAYKKNKKISKQYDLSPDILASWLHRLTLIRNFCAHNSRVWNRKYNKISLKKDWNYHSWFYLEGTLFFIKYIIDKIKPEYDFNPLYTLIDSFIKKYPKKAIYMGIITPDKLKYLIETPKI